MQTIIFNIALAKFDAYTRFKAMAITGNPEAGLRILDKHQKSITGNFSLWDSAPLREVKLYS
jgi:hypothetical protein